MSKPTITIVVEKLNALIAILSEIYGTDDFVESLTLMAQSSELIVAAESALDGVAEGIPNADLSGNEALQASARALQEALLALAESGFPGIDPQYFEIAF